jgi:isopenicillin N synthase-like dioxygenase
VTTKAPLRPSIATLSYPQAHSDPVAFKANLRSAVLGSPTSFFYLTDIEDDPMIGSTWIESWRAAFETSERFFALPTHVKDEISMIRSPRFRGWSGEWTKLVGLRTGKRANKRNRLVHTAVGVETTQGKQDWREQIDFGCVQQNSKLLYMRIAR